MLKRKGRRGRGKMGKKRGWGKRVKRGRQILIASMLATSTSSPVEVREGSEK